MVHFPAGASVAFESAGPGPGTLQQMWVLEGRIDVALGTERHRLDEGDCLAMALAQPTLFGEIAGFALWPQGGS